MYCPPKGEIGFCNAKTMVPLSVLTIVSPVNFDLSRKIYFLVLHLTDNTETDMMHLIFMPT